jgi:hypothetical protein
MDMKTHTNNGQEEATMTRKHFKIRLGLALAILVAALGIISSAPARTPVEPGSGSPVTYNHPRHPARQHARQRSNGGYPATTGVHVKSAAEARTE